MSAETLGRARGKAAAPAPVAAARLAGGGYFRLSTRSMYSCIAASALLPFTPAQASCLARPTRSVKPGRLPSTSPSVACLYSA